MLLGDSGSNLLLLVTIFWHFIIGTLVVRNDLIRTVLDPDWMAPKAELPSDLLDCPVGFTW